MLARVAPSRPEVNLIVAASDMQVGAKIADRDLKVVRYPSEDLPVGVY